MSLAPQHPTLTKALVKVRERGLRESVRLGAQILRARAVSLSSRRQQAFVFLSPPLGNSGAPLILAEIVQEFASRVGSQSVRLLAPPGAVEPRGPSEVSGVKVERAAEVLSPSLVRLQLALRKNDFVFMNTTAVSRNYLEAVLEALRSGRLSHAYWYILEDADQLSALAPYLLRPEARSAIGQLMTQRQLTILVPSKKVKAGYDELFGNAEIGILPFKMETGTHLAARPADHYSSVRFLISGSPTDGRKGHIVALAAFHEFMKAYYEPDPGAYRPFTLTLVGMTDDYISEQIRSIGSTVLGDRLKALSGVPHHEALEITRDCNAVICCSFHETGPMYVLEGMRRGHVVLRNDVGGMDEQLDDGVNGFRIDSKDIRQFAGVLARMLDKNATPDSRLQAMGRASQALVPRLLIPSYADAIQHASSEVRFARPASRLD